MGIISEVTGVGIGLRQEKIKWVMRIVGIVWLCQNCLLELENERKIVRWGVKELELGNGSLFDFLRGKRDKVEQLVYRWWVGGNKW